MYIAMLLFIHVNGHNYKTIFSDICNWKYSNIFVTRTIQCVTVGCFLVDIIY